MSLELALTLTLAALLAFTLAWLSSVGGMGGGVLMLFVFTALFGLQVAVPMLTLTQLASNGGRVWFNRADVRWRLVGWHALGAVPLAAAGSLLFTHAPAAPLKHLLGALLIVTVVWRRLRPSVAKPPEKAFIAIGGATGLGSAVFGAVGPMVAPFFLAYGLVGGAYIATEAATSLTVHLVKIAVYGAGSLVSLRVLLLGAALTPAVIAGTWVGRKTLTRMSSRLFTVVIEVGMIVAGLLFLVGF